MSKQANSELNKLVEITKTEHTLIKLEETVHLLQQELVHNKITIQQMATELEKKEETIQQLKAQFSYMAPSAASAYSAPAPNSASMNCWETNGTRNNKQLLLVQNLLST
jgi:chromosome segregation ATPase